MKILGIGLLAMVATLSMGCAAQAQCLREVDELEKTSHEQDRQIRDLEGKVAAQKTEQAGTTLSSLATESWEVAKAAFGWAKAEAPIVAHQANESYQQASDRMEKARKCYQDHGGNETHTYEEYKAIANACLNSN